MEREKPPDDISPSEFFTRWIPQAVARDADRQRRLRDTDATIVFDLEGEEGGVYTVRVGGGLVEGRSGRADTPDLVVRVDVGTWRMLNSGEISAPQALLKRKVHLDGDFLLGLKLHLILG